MFEENLILNPNGDCLGVAVQDVYALIGLNPPSYLTLKGKRSVYDAILLLSLQNLQPNLYLSPDLIFPVRFAALIMANIRKLPVIKNGGFPDGSVALCFRTARQLYGLASSAGHWVVLYNLNSKINIIDRIVSVSQYEVSHKKIPADILNQVGPTLVVKRS